MRTLLSHIVGGARHNTVKTQESDERMAAPVRVPWGEVPGRAALAGYMREIVTHTRDLSEALGYPPELAPDLA